jgi:hypothetical protein
MEYLEWQTKEIHFGLPLVIQKGVRYLSHYRGGIRQQSHIPGPFDCQRQQALVLRTIARYSTWRYLTPFCREIPECSGVLIVNYQCAVRTKFTYFSSVVGLFVPTAAVRAIIPVCHFPSLVMFQSLVLLFLLSCPLRRPLLLLIMLQDLHCLPVLWSDILEPDHLVSNPF